MAWTVEFRDVALEDLRGLPGNIRARVVRAVEQRLGTEPQRYGSRLRRSLTGLWKLRVGDLRVVYVVEGSRVTVWAVLNRKLVYPEAARRWEAS